jgi:glutathione S-transferase
VLTHPIILPKPIADSLDITYYITTQYPNLLPENHKDQIIELLKQLHNINYFSLSFGSKPAAANAQKLAVEEKLAQSAISEKYRRALEYKMMMYAPSFHFRKRTDQ